MNFIISPIKINKSSYLIIKYHWIFETVFLENAKSRHTIFVQYGVAVLYKIFWTVISTYNVAQHRRDYIGQIWEFGQESCTMFVKGIRNYFHVYIHTICNCFRLYIHTICCSSRVYTHTIRNYFHSDIHAICNCFHIRLHTIRNYFHIYLCAHCHDQTFYIFISQAHSQAHSRNSQPRSTLMSIDIY